MAQHFMLPMASKWPSIMLPIVSNLPTTCQTAYCGLAHNGQESIQTSNIDDVGVACWLILLVIL